MKSHVLLLTVLSIVFPFHFIFSNPNPPVAAIEFQRLFGNGMDNRFNKVIRAGDDYYLLGTDEITEGATPHATLTRLNFQGQLQWTIRLSVPSTWNDIIVTDEGNLLLVGGTSPYDANANSIIGLATPSGNFQWVRYYNFAERELLTKVVRHPNPANPAFPYYILGVTQQQNSATNDDINLLNINAAGTVNWRRVLGNNADEEFYRDLEVLANGNFLLVGHAGSAAVTVEMNTSGAVVTGNSYGTGMRINDAVERPGSGFILAGSSSPSTPAQISRLNANYQSVWSRTIPQLAFLNRVWIGPDQAIYAMGYGNVNGTTRNVVLKITETNNIPSIQWVKYLDDGETAFANGNLFFLSPDQMAYVDGRTDNAAGFGQGDAFLSVSSLDLGTCITLGGPTLSMTSVSLANNAYTAADASGNVPAGQDLPIQGVAWQQVAVCGSSCEPVITNTFSTILAQQTGQESELALEGFQASNGEYVTLGLSTAFSPFSLDLVFTRMDDQGNLLGSPQQLDFEYNGEFLENFVDGEGLRLNAHMTEAFDPTGQSQGYFLAATMFAVNGALSPDILTALIDHSGCIVWSRFTERAATDEYARDVLQLPNGELVVLIYRFDASNGNNNMELLKLSLNGQSCTSLLYELPSTDDFFPSVITNVEGLPNPSATVAVGGYRVFGQRYLGIYLLESDLSMATPGPLLFDILPANPEETPTPTGLVQSGQNLVVAGYMKKNSTDREAFLMEVRPFTPSGQIDGNTQWARRIRVNAGNGLFGNGYEFFALEREPQTGDLLLAGTATGANDGFYRAFLIKTNADGQVQWVNLFPGAFGNEIADNALAYDLDITNEGNLMVSGYRPRPDSSDGFLWVGVTDQHGNLHNCDCFDPMTLQVENYQPVFSQTTSPEPTPGSCNGAITIPACVAYTPNQLFCDQYSPQAPCQASFSWEPNNQCGETGFSNQSNGALPSYFWQFGDPLNSASSEVNPTFTYFSSGTYNVCLTITTADCTDTYCEAVTVVIAGAPATLTCPPDIMVQADPGACENASYQLPDAVVIDNCPCDPLLDVTYEAGYDGPYSGGANTFTVTAIDGCAVVSCEVTVTVDDGEAPVITCPEDVLLQLGSPTGPASTGEATATDPCGEVTITYSDDLVFSAECESRTERTWIASDDAGNADTCVQIIELKDLTPLTVICPADIEVLAGPPDCSASLEAIDIEFADDCISLGTLEYGFTLTGATTGDGLGFPVQTVHFQIGVTNVEIWAVEFPGAYASCQFTVTVAENVPPAIDCPAPICIVADPGANQAVVEFADPVASDNCSTPVVLSAPASGSGFPLGSTLVNCTATDASGNEATCSFTVEVLPGDFSGQFNAIPQPGCGETYAFEPLFLDPALQYAWDFGDGQVSSQQEPSHTYSADGLYTVSLTVSSPLGCTASSQEQVEVLMQLEGVVSYESDCLNASFLGIPDDPSFTWTWDLPGGPQQGSIAMASFPEYGTYEVCATLSDGSCTVEYCQTIVLSDTEDPEISCPGEHIATDPGLCTATFTPSLPAATDNCTDPQQLAYVAVRFDGLPLNAPWPVGNNCLTWTVTDLAGNIGLCVQCITVADEEAPVMECPGDVTVEAAPGAGEAVVEFDNTTATDNCSSPVAACSAGSGDTFPLGTTEVTCEISDDAGNAASCTFYVTVLPGFDTCCVDQQAFIDNVNAGFSWTSAGGCQYSVTPNQLNPCQQVIEWQWGDGEVSVGPFAGNEEVVHTYQADGDYEICMLAAELDEGSGDVCWEATFCQTLSVSCGNSCELNALQISTGFDYANGVFYPDSAAVDAYWAGPAGMQMATVPEVDSMPPLAGSLWIAPLVQEGYGDHRVEFRFCLPNEPFNCEDLLFDLDIQAWAVATVRINGRPVSDPLFGSPAYGGPGNWLFQPSAADCGLFREGSNVLTIDLKTVFGGAGLSVSGTVSTLSGEPVLGPPDCCSPAPECACDGFEFNNLGIEASALFEGNQCLRSFRPLGIEACDEVEWYVNASLVATGTGGDWVFMELPNGAVSVCMRVTRTEPGGNACGVIEKCLDLIVECGGEAACGNGMVANPGFEGSEGVLGQGGGAAPWLPAFGSPYVAEGPGAADPGWVIISGNEDDGDALYQFIEPEVGKVYQLSLNVKRYLPSRAGEDTRLIVFMSDQPQTSGACTGNCHTLGILNEFSEDIWYHYVYSWLAYSEDLKYLTVMVENDFDDDGSAASRSYIQVDNICIDSPDGTEETPGAGNILLYPNPAKEEFTVVLPAPAVEEYQVVVFDLWGRQVLGGSIGQGAIRSGLSLKDLPAAVYWVEVRGERGSIWREKLIKG